MKDTGILKKCLTSAVLNGVVFYGSVLWADLVLGPLVEVILRGGLTSVASEAAVGRLKWLVMGIYHLGWVLPTYLISFVVSVVWSQEVADLAFTSEAGNKEPGRPTGGVAVKKLYDKMCSMLVLTMFWLEKLLVGYIPVVGTAAEAVLFAWLMAFYCFDYGWCIQEKGLQRRILIFEHNWAFFLGFGTPLALILQFSSFYKSAMLSGVLFPLSVLVACGTDTTKVEGFNNVIGVQNVDVNRTQLFSIFGIATHAANFIIHVLLGDSGIVRVLWEGALRYIDWLSAVIRL